MKTLILAALLLLPTTPGTPIQGVGSFPEAVLPPCNPPAGGDWWVATDCLLSGDHAVTGSVYVFFGSRLELAPGASLDLDFQLRHLWIGAGSRVIVGAGARIH